MARRSTRREILANESSEQAKELLRLHQEFRVHNCRRKVPPTYRGPAVVRGMPRKVQPAGLSIERACYAVAELTRRAERTEEHDLLCVVVLVGLDEVSLPAARVRVGPTPTLAAGELEGSHDAMIARTGWSG